MLEYLQDFMKDYGYWAVAIGTFIEGETVLILGGIMAQLGYIKLFWVIVLSIIGGVGGEIAFYFFGRWKGREFVLTNRLTRRLYPKGKRLVDKYGYWGIFVSRYMVGMRAIAGVIFGIAKMNPFWYILLQFISVSTWAIWIGVAGYFFGLAINNALGDLRRYQLYFFTVVGVGLLFWWGLSHIRQVKLSPRNSSRPQDTDKTKAEGPGMAEIGK